MAIVWPKITAAALLATTVLAAVPFGQASAATFGASSLSYDDALLSQFNLINLGNLNTTTGSGVSGRVVVGGNYNTTAGGSTDCYASTCTGNTTTAVDASGNPQNSSGANGYGAVTVFGNIVGGISNTNGGDIDVKGNVSGNTYNLNGKGGLNLGGTSQSSTTANAPTEVRTTQTNAQGSVTNYPNTFTVQTGDTMAQVFAPFANSGTLANTFSNPLINLSRGIAALPGTPGVNAQALPSNSTSLFTSAANGADYTYNGYKYGVVTTTMANLAQEGSGFTGVANGAGNAATFVIITGDTGNLLPSLTYNDPKVIYDFVNATSLTFNGSFVGSILAPLATITQNSNSGTINGSIVVAAFNQTKELLSSDTFTGDLGGLTGVQFSAVPEPASLLLLGVGAAATAWSRRRRK